MVLLTLGAFPSPSPPSLSPQRSRALLSFAPKPPRLIPPGNLSKLLLMNLYFVLTVQQKWIKSVSRDHMSDMCSLREQKASRAEMWCIFTFSEVSVLDNLDFNNCILRIQYSPEMLNSWAAWCTVQSRYSTWMPQGVVNAGNVASIFSRCIQSFLKAMMRSVFFLQSHVNF